MRKLGASFVLALMASLLVSVAPAQAGPVLVVDNDGADCKKADFTSIQAAVNAAGPGTKIEVCPGTYTEKVVIGAAKSGLELKSKKDLEAVIAMPATMSGAIVEIIGATGVKLEGFTITGPGVNCPLYGVRVVSGASVELKKNHITKIRRNPLSGCQTASAIMVGRAAESTTGTATIRDNLIDDYQKTGIAVDGAGSSADIEHNTITGVGPTGVIAQNGIQVSRGATGVVKDNDVSGNYYSGATFASAGILTFAGGAPAISHNDSWDNNVNYYLQDLAGGKVDHNSSSGGEYGFLLYSASGNELSHNQSSDTLYNFYLYLSDDNSVAHNKSERGDYGYLIYDADDNVIAHNKGDDAAFDGIYAFGTGNLFDKNHLEGNAEHDAHDDSAPANTWTKNKCETSSPAGLCD